MMNLKESRRLDLITGRVRKQICWQGEAGSGDGGCSDYALTDTGTRSRNNPG